jgi:hypothetical protein
MEGTDGWSNTGQIRRNGQIFFSKERKKERKEIKISG